jgi:hypothetical protein
MSLIFESPSVLSKRKKSFSQNVYIGKGEGVCVAAALEFIRQCFIKDSKSMTRTKELADALEILTKDMAQVVDRHRSANEKLAVNKSEYNRLALRQKNTLVRHKILSEVRDYRNDQRTQLLYLLRLFTQPNAVLDQNELIGSKDSILDAAKQLEDDPSTRNKALAIRVLFERADGEYEKLQEAVIARVLQSQRTVAQADQLSVPYEQMSADIGLKMSLSQNEIREASGSFGPKVAECIHPNDYFMYVMRMGSGDGSGHAGAGFRSTRIKGKLFSTESEVLVLFDPNLGIFRCPWAKAATFLESWHRGYITKLGKQAFPKWQVSTVTLL